MQDSKSKKNESTLTYIKVNLEENGGVGGHGQLLALVHLGVELRLGDAQGAEALDDGIHIAFRSRVTATNGD